MGKEISNLKSTWCIVGVKGENILRQFLLNAAKQSLLATRPMRDKNNKTSMGP